MGVVLGGVEVCTVDEAGREAFVTEHVLQLLRKVRPGGETLRCGSKGKVGRGAAYVVRLVWDWRG